MFHIYLKVSWAESNENVTFLMVPPTQGQAHSSHLCSKIVNEHNNKQIQ